MSHNGRTITWKLNPQLFWDNDFHLSKTGSQKFSTSLFNFISLCNTSKSTSFNLMKIDKSFPPLLRTNIHIVFFKKHKFSIIYDGTMQSVNFTSVSACRPVSKNQPKRFFCQSSTLLRGTVNVCKLCLHCPDVCNIDLVLRLYVLTNIIVFHQSNVLC